ncbi:Kae1-associated kinase Bud32 [Candidatus Woesearchaeota archaeon]|nr:Kae1-associated kinase Bud32 [Candidatus Woesearchaeota archaeon]
MKKDVIIGRGAEATLYLTKDGVVRKVRHPKKYRLGVIDDNLRFSRTKREKKVYEKLSIPHPKLLGFGDDYLEIEYVDGDVLKDVFDVKYSKLIGEHVATMHDSGIVHGDLTTSNMILKDKTVFFIDFGLSFFSTKVEDKAVDLHLFYRALESKHHKEFEKAFKSFLEGYKKSENYDSVMNRFEIVEKRGRNKHK